MPKYIRGKKRKLLSEFHLADTLAGRYCETIPGECTRESGLNIYTGNFKPQMDDVAKVGWEEDDEEGLRKI